MAKRLSKRNNSRSAVFIGIAVIAVVIAVAALSRNVAPLTRSAPGTNSDIVKMFDSELNISGSLSDIGVEYAFGNMSTELNSGAQQIHVLQSETIYSYRLGGYSKSVMDTSLSYMQGQNTLDNYSNITSYFNTPALKLRCVNQSVYRTSGASNATVSCVNGSTSEQAGSFPLSINAAVGLAAIANGYSGSYLGKRNISGRMCDDYLFSNTTYAVTTTYNICLDRNYGIPVYMNETVFKDGVYSHSTYMVLKRIYTSLNSSYFKIPVAGANISNYSN